jgi:hypothetical protein
VCRPRWRECQRLQSGNFKTLGRRLLSDPDVRAITGERQHPGRELSLGAGNFNVRLPQTANRFRKVRKVPNRGRSETHVQRTNDRPFRWLNLSQSPRSSAGYERESSAIRASQSFATISRSRFTEA